MNRLFVCLVLIPIGCLSSNPACSQESKSKWTIESQQEWESSLQEKQAIELEKGMIQPAAKNAFIRSQIKTFPKQQTINSFTVEQSPIWQNWEPIDNVGPSNLGDAPVMLCVGPDDYWMFGRYRGKKKKEGQKKFERSPAKLDGFDVDLFTTPFKNQFDAAGGLKPGLGGYHAWQSRDMVNWVHHGPVTEKFSVWVTTAEYADGKVYIYYDYPNDQDPHLYIDDDLTDGLPGKNMGIAFKDPSHGSDCGFIRDLQGKFHVIYEDWSPISANKRSWDSPLAGRAVSDNGIDGFKIMNPAVDKRTKPTGETGTYKHPHWHHHPDWDSNLATYEIHKPEQEAYGDWAAICIGGQYYLFGDFDPVGGHKMSACWFTSSQIDQPFEWCDNIGEGHPDPDIGFAEGRFYMVTQQKKDYVSDGPWVETVESRIGVDTGNDGKIDHWSEWQEIHESYDHMPGFAKQIKRKPASMDLSDLPSGFGFQFELRLIDSTENKSKPIIDKVSMDFSPTKG